MPFVNVSNLGGSICLVCMCVCVCVYVDSSVTVDDGFDGLRTWLGIGVRPDVRWFLSPPSPLCSPIWGNVASSWQLFIKVKVKVCVCVCVCVRVYLVGLPLMVMAFASSTVISADLWISFFGWSGLCTAHPVP